MATLEAMFKMFNGYISKIEKINKSFKELKKGTDFIDGFMNTNARLGSINDGLQTQAELQDKVFAAANRSRGAYVNMASAISEMGILAEDAFSSNDELIAFMELAQKSFKISDASPTEQSSALSQLTQAMSTGAFQGDGFSSILDNAPVIAEAIAKYTGLSKDELKSMSVDGLITSDIIKNAMFAMSKDINGRFEDVSITFADIWNRIKNGGLKAFRPIIEEVNKLIETEGFENFVNGLITGFNRVSQVAGFLINIISSIGSFFTNNWSIIEPLLWGIIGALVVYNATSGIAYLNTLKMLGAKMLKVAADWLEYAAIFALILVQDGLNAALAACPITWIIIAVIALIAIFYAAVAAVNKFAGTSISATGIIAGAFMVALAFVGNLFVGLWNLIADLIVNIWNGYANVAEFLANVFNDPIGSIVRLFAGMADTVLGILEGIASVIDTLFGSNLASSISGWRSGLQGIVDNLVGEAEIKVPRMDSSSMHLDRFEYGTAWDIGYSAGESFQNKFSFNNLFDGISDLGTIDNNLYDNISDLDTIDNNNPLIVEGTGNNKAVEVDMSDEDLKYLRDIAEREYINKFSAATLAPNIQVTFGDVHENADADKVAGRIRKILQEEIATAAEGVYA
ncbi:tape measure protein [Proteiniborus sp. MB09-C3]|uniref:tape measure protein n=1 Tax=Proteiniborus sp. MB09-C3 TaxID=3050072 RepID=UPI0025579CB0|nr:tape measure protein [Proteiniborus sp. MB09-C3]WIV11375.1 tape measure protein [Proteiniborus sp. MB09-C3]